MVTSKRNVCLTDRDFVVLEHVANYGLTVNEVIEQLPCFSGNAKNTADGVRRRLLRGGYLGRQELGSDRHRFCYYLTEKARTALGSDTVRGGRLKDEPRIRAFAVLAFCCLSHPKRELLSREDLAESFPALNQPQRRVNYYIDSEGPKSRLAYIRVDFGRSESVPIDRLIDYCRRDIDNILALPTAVRLAKKNSLQLTVLTAMRQKAKLFKHALLAFEEQGDALPLPVRICEVPELRELIAPIKR